MAVSRSTGRNRETTMPEQPTDEQKMQAAEDALAQLDPPVKVGDDISGRTLEIIVTVFWSQQALVPAAADAPAPTYAPLFCELMSSDDPELQARIVTLNQDAAKLGEDIRHAAAPAPASKKDT